MGPRAAATVGCLCSCRSSCTLGLLRGLLINGMSDAGSYVSYAVSMRFRSQSCLPLKVTYNGVFAGKFKFAFDRKPNQIPALGIRVQPDLQAIGFKQKDTVQSSISATPPKMLTAHGSTCVIGQPPKSLQTVLHSILLF